MTSMYVAASLLSSFRMLWARMLWAFFLFFPPYYQTMTKFAYGDNFCAPRSDIPKANDLSTMVLQCANNLPDIFKLGLETYGCVLDLKARIVRGTWTECHPSLYLLESSFNSNTVQYLFCEWDRMTLTRDMKCNPL